jgi:hypothetical protein
MHKIFIYDQENHVCIVACLAFTNASKEETKKEMHDTQKSIVKITTKLCLKIGQFVFDEENITKHKKEHLKKHL